jgi:hypothetical protein
MGRRPRLCPCHECDVRGKSFVDARTWEQHADEMKEGTRYRHASAAFQAADADEARLNQEAERLADEAAAVVAQEEEEIGPRRTLDPLKPSDVGRIIATEIAELVARGTIKQTGADAVLKVFQSRTRPFLANKVILPPSWYMCEKMARVGVVEPKSYERDFCHVCDHLFLEDPADTRCPRCKKPTRFNRNGICERTATYFDLDDMIRGLFRSSGTAQAAAYGAQYPVPDKPMHERELRDCFDGSLLNDFLASQVVEQENALFFTLSNDGVELRKNQSYTPITCKCLNLPPKLRGLLASIWLLGYMPPNVKDYQAFLKPVAEMFARHLPGGAPLHVKVCSTCSMPLYMYIMIHAGCIHWQHATAPSRPRLAGQRHTWCAQRYNGQVPSLLLGWVQLLQARGAATVPARPHCAPRRRQIPSAIRSYSFSVRCGRLCRILLYVSSVCIHTLLTPYATIHQIRMFRTLLYVFRMLS